MASRFDYYRHCLHPVQELRFHRPLVLMQSDDWGLLGLRNLESFQRLRRKGLPLGKGAYDYYSFETANDLYALCEILNRHQDSAGNPPVLVCNFVLANVDFPLALASDLCELPLKPLHEGLPQPWSEESTLAMGKPGIMQGLLYPALHGISHFCYPAVKKILTDRGARALTLRWLYEEGTSLVYPQTPWVGFEFKDEGDILPSTWLQRQEQERVVQRGVAMFAETFGKVPLSACAPGYRANPDTFRAWADHGLRVVQNGPGIEAPPYLGPYGLLYLHRNVPFEPALDLAFHDLENVYQTAARHLRSGRPAILCIHSINFQSRLKNFRDRTLALLDELLNRLEREFEDLLYVHDENLWQIVQLGAYTTKGVTVEVPVDRTLRTSPLIKHIARQRIANLSRCGRIDDSHSATTFVHSSAR